MPERVLAATTVGRLKTEIREYPFPDIPPDAGILQIEAAGVCGSDGRSYQLDRPARIMGHENVGRVYRIGPIATRQWNVKEGDQVALEEYLPCGHCGQRSPGAIHVTVLPWSAQAAGAPSIRPENAAAAFRCARLKES